MPIPIPTPPETKYEITADEFISAAKGQRFKQTEWFYRKMGREIIKDGTFYDLDLQDNQHYIVLAETHCLSTYENFLFLSELNDPDYQTSFIFINCILPGLLLGGIRTDDWIFINTNMNEGIQVDDKSQVGNINIQKNSRLGDIRIYNESKSKDIIILDDSLVGDIWMDKKSECDDVFIHTNSQCGNIQIDNKSQCGSIRVEKKSLVGDLKIDNNSKVGDIDVDNQCEAGRIWVYNDSHCADIMVEDGSRCEDIRIVKNSKSGYIRIYVNSQCGCIEVEYSSKCNNIWVQENSQCGYILIDASQSGFIWITENSQSGSIRMDNSSEAESVSINNNSHCEFIRLDNGSKSGYIEIDKNSLCDSLGIYSSSQTGILKIIRGSQSGDIVIDEGKVNRMQISQNYCSVLLRSATVSIMLIERCCLNQLIWQAGTKAELYIDHCRINHLNLCKTSLLKDSAASIINSRIYIVQLQELLLQGQLILRNIESTPEPFIWQPPVIGYIEEHKPGEDADKRVMDIYIAKKEQLQKQENNYSAQLEGLKSDPILTYHKKPLFRIVNSSLGKTEITGSDLTGFNFEYKDSKLLEVFINGAKLPKEKIDIYNEMPESALPDKIYFEQKISIYNQLKKIFENQGDIVETTWYHTKAMANQERLLSLLYDEKAGKAPRKWWSEEAFDLFNFRLNKVSNNHGESWRRALCFSLYVLFSIYTLYFISVNSGNRFSFSGIGDFIGSFFSFLDITHKIDFMVEKEELNGFAKFLDFFGRVAIIYCSYQFVSAFRRHGKRG